jgi:hypothetical protein
MFFGLVVVQPSSAFNTLNIAYSTAVVTIVFSSNGIAHGTQIAISVHTATKGRVADLSSLSRISFNTFFILVLRMANCVV